MILCHIVLYIYIIYTFMFFSYLSLFIYIYIYIYTSLSLSLSLYVYVYMHIHIYIYIYIWIDRYIFPSTPPKKRRRSTRATRPLDGNFLRSRITRTLHLTFKLRKTGRSDGSANRVRGGAVYYSILCYIISSTSILCYVIICYSTV